MSGKKIAVFREEICNKVAAYRRRVVIITDWIPII